MKKEFICLAKSQKFNGRCVAGVLIKRNQKTNSIFIEKDQSGQPIWIRPLGSTISGEIEESIGDSLELLGIYEIEDVIPTPDGYQSENVKYRDLHYKKTAKISKNKKNLEACCDKVITQQLFGNKGKAIPKDTIGSVNNSIKLIKVVPCTVYVKKRDNRTDQYRLIFSYNKYKYDLPVTDLEFKLNYEADNDIFNKHENCYITVSIGVEYEDWYYKLVASVILV